MKSLVALLCVPVCMATLSPLAGAASKPAPDSGLKCPVLTLPAGYTPPAAVPKDAADIKLVVYAVQQALLCYQNSGATYGSHLPALQTAAFDFKTSSSLNLSPSVSFFIFTLGAGVEKDDVQDFTLSYSVPPKTLSPRRPNPNTPDFVDELATLIRDAAAAATTQNTALSLPLNSVTVSVQFGIQINENAGLSFPISFITAGARLSQNKNTADSVTLTFHDAPPIHSPTKPPGHR